MRFTYLKPYWKVIHDRSFMVDRILGFNYYRSEPVKRENYTGYVGVEAMMYYIFLYKGTVQDYSIKHKIAGRNKKGDWETGPYDTGDLALDSVSLWPGSIQDTSRYYRQRTESDLRRINEHKISDFKEEDRFIAEMEKRFGKMSDEDRQEVYDITGKPEKELFNMIASGASYDDIMKAVKKAQPAYY